MVDHYLKFVTSNLEGVFLTSSVSPSRTPIHIAEVVHIRHYLQESYISDKPIRFWQIRHFLQIQKFLARFLQVRTFLAGFSDKFCKTMSKNWKKKFSKKMSGMYIFKLFFIYLCFADAVNTFKFRQFLPSYFYNSGIFFQDTSKIRHFPPSYFQDQVFSSKLLPRFTHFWQDLA